LQPAAARLQSCHGKRRATTARSQLTQRLADAEAEVEAKERDVKLMLVQMLYQAMTDEVITADEMSLLATELESLQVALCLQQPLSDSWRLLSDCTS
jgi:hypothetical protein